MEKRGDSWSQDYTEEQVESVLNTCNVEVNGETYSDFIAMCPYHGNVDTPSFTISKTNGKFFCFNPACNAAGNLVDLVKYARKCNDFEAARLIIKRGTESKIPVKERLVKDKPVDFVEFDQSKLDELRASFWNNHAAQAYMNGRGFKKETVEYFDVGLSSRQDMVVVPMHTSWGMPIGVIGRSIEGKSFKNSSKLPRNKTTWNFHRARVSDAVVITESVFDSMRVYQAGYPSSIALLGGYASKEHIAQIDRSFRKIVIMTDFDDKSKHIYKHCRKCLGLCNGHNPGRELGHTIATALPNKLIRWASFESEMVYPHGAKDASDMTDVEIAQCIDNAVAPIEYARWKL